MNATKQEMSKLRVLFLKSLPFVTYLSRGRQCEGFMSHTSLKHVFGTDEQRAKRPKCKNPAHWKFTALKKSTADSGVYCQSHLFSRCLYGDMDEEKRTEQYAKDWAAKSDA